MRSGAAVGGAGTEARPRVFSWNPAGEGIGPPTPDDPQLELGPVSVRRPILHFAVAGAFALITVGVLTAVAARSVGLDFAIEDAHRMTATHVEALIEPVLTDAVVDGDPAALATLDAVVRGSVLRTPIVRIKIWTRDGTIVYSDESRLIGETFPLEPEELRLFDGGRAHVDVTELAREENEFETGSKLLEIYVLTRTLEGTPVLFEGYFEYESVRSISSTLWSRFAPIALGALLVLELVQIPLVWRLARRLRAGQVARERLLSHAIEASNAERRRIACDLHDGVVQELTGVSLSLAAAARRAPDPEPTLRDASAAIRATVVSLRTLLVDIYPPNLFDEGLESALHDLLKRLEHRGIATRLSFDGAGSDLPAGVAGLLYRTAQEAVRNVEAHSGATSVAVDVHVRGLVASVAVSDDGRGFTEEIMRQRTRAGHVGLQALAGLVRDAGGRIEIQSAPGGGSRVCAEVPLTSRLGGEWER